MSSIIQEVRDAIEWLLSVRSRSRKRVGDFVGPWHAYFQSEHAESVGEWVADMVQISRRPFGRMKFQNFNNERSQYEATGTFVTEQDIVGSWREIKPGARYRGSFHVFVDVSGRWLYGLCSGQADRGRPAYGGWLLARNADDLRFAYRDLCAALLVHNPASPPPPPPLDM